MLPYPSLLHLDQLVHIEVVEELLENSKLVNNHVARELNTCHVKVMRSKWIMIMVILPYFSPSPANKNLTTKLFKRKHRLKVSIYIQWPQMVNTKRFPITMLSYLMFMIHDFQFGQWTVDIRSKSNEDLFAGKAPTLVKR